MSTLAATALKHASSTSNNIILDSSGNVGVGTSSPANNSGYSTVTVNGSTGGVIQFQNAGTNIGQIFNTGSDLQVRAVANVPLAFYTNNTERGRFTATGDLQFNSGYGSVATAYGCRAWVNFNATPATLSIRSSANISSITDNGVGDFTVNFTNALPDANYSVQFTTDGPVNTAHCVGFVSGSVRNLFSTTQVAIATHILTNSATRADPSYGQVAVFR